MPGIAHPSFPVLTVDYRRILSHADQQQAYEDIANLIEAVRRSWSPEEYRWVQQQLSRHIDRVDVAVGQANIRLARAHKQLIRQQRSPSPSSPELTQAEAEYRQALFDKDLYLRLGRQYRAVGDALAWQLYRFQALPIFALGLNESPGPTTTKVGAEAEAEEVERYWRNHHAFALRHDFTNTLRVWDLSILYSERSDGIEIAEVKKSQHTRGRQNAQGRIVIELVKQHVCTRRDGRVLVHYTHQSQLTSGHEPTNLRLLHQALAQSKRESAGFAANPYLAVTVVDIRNPGKLAPAAFQTRLGQIQNIPVEIQLPPCADFVVGNSFERLSRPGFGVPYTVFPLYSLDAAALITGYVRAHYQLNTTAITQALEAAGFEVECLLPGLRGKLIKLQDYFRLRRGSVTISIGGFPVNQILFEGLRLEDLVDSVKAQAHALGRQTLIIPSWSVQGRRRLDALSTHMNLEQAWRSSRRYLLPLEGEPEQENEKSVLDYEIAEHAAGSSDDEQAPEGSE